MEWGGGLLYLQFRINKSGELKMPFTTCGVKVICAARLLTHVSIVVRQGFPDSGVCGN